ncbi:hypothetical protein [Agrobacterium rosae]|uniref:hypothetical protein n=1 Tax=Agrobacterium rosae TaxID=1972867 RepID=UPI0011B6E30A|nr:hypothetical protein [Agrobacterium rosae]
MQKPNRLCMLCRNVLCIGIAAAFVGLIVGMGAATALVLGEDPAIGTIASLSLMFLVFIVVNFPLRMSDVARSKMRGKFVFHYTSVENQSGIERNVNGVTEICILPSRGYQNTFNRFAAGECAFFFSKEPTPFQNFVNRCGTGSMAQSARVLVRGEDLPDRVYWRIWDGSVLIPNGYCGPGQFVVADRI